MKGITQQSIDGIAKAFLKETTKETNRINKFYLDRFYSVIRDIKGYFKASGETCIIDENLEYAPLLYKKYNITYGDFCDVFACLDTVLEIKWHNMRDAQFPTQYYNFKGLKFEKIHGQGTALIISKRLRK